jgi:chromosome segregation ATPase
MKYEKLNRIPAKRTVWPENKVVDFEAYESKPVDEAFQEIMNWYTESKTKAETLEKELTELKQSSAKVYEEKTKEATDALLLAEKTRANNESLSWKTKDLEGQLAESKQALEVANARLISTQMDFNAMVNSINQTTEQNQSLQSELAKIKEEVTKLKSELNTQKENYNSLEIQYNTSLNQLDQVEKTMGSISDLVSFYKEWKKNS